MLKGLAASLRAQNWISMTFELLIVILGVFLGTWVANWNQERIERREVESVIRKLERDVESRIASVAGGRRYYDVTADYTRTALAGWRGDPSVSDAEFVTAAYQASQILSLDTENQVYVIMLGGDRIRNYPDEEVRDAIIQLLNFNTAPLSLEAANSRYREDVRAVIPDEIQDAIRRRCGDRVNDRFQTYLPPRCSIDLPDTVWETAAAELRAHEELVGELNEHRSGVSTLLNFAGLLNLRLENVRAVLERRRREA